MVVGKEEGESQLALAWDIALNFRSKFEDMPGESISAADAEPADRGRGVPNKGITGTSSQVLGPTNTRLA